MSGFSPLGSSPGTPPPLTYGGTAYPPSYPGGIYGAANTQAADVKALSRVTTASLLAIISFFLSIAAVFVTPALNVAGDVGTTSPGTVAGAALTELILLVVAGVAIAFVELWLFRNAFGDLAPFDDRFSTPKTLTLLAIIGLVFLVVGVVGILALVLQAVACANGGPISASCVNGGAILGLAGLTIIFGIIFFIGYIGLLIGIWRLGTRYNNGLFKAGAILLIFIPIIGAVLIYVAARQARGALVTVPRPGAFG